MDKITLILGTVQVTLTLEQFESLRDQVFHIDALLTQSAQQLSSTMASEKQSQDTLRQGLFSNFPMPKDFSNQEILLYERRRWWLAQELSSSKIVNSNFARSLAKGILRDKKARNLRIYREQGKLTPERVLAMSEEELNSIRN